MRGPETSLSPDDVRRAKQDADLIALCEQDGFSPKRNAGKWWIHCPFHAETTPSCCIYDHGRDAGDAPHYHCFGCGKHGDAIHWLMEVRGNTFQQACGVLLGRSLSGTTESAPVRRIAPVAASGEAEKPAFVFRSEEAVTAVLTKEGATVEGIYRFRNREDTATLLWEFRLRLPPKEDGSPGKKRIAQAAPSPDGTGLVCRLPKNFVRPLYALPIIAKLDPSAWLWMVGGPRKAEAIRACGFAATSCSGGEIALGHTDLEPFVRHPKRIIWPDADDAGTIWATTLRARIRREVQLGHAIDGELLEVIPAELGFERDSGLDVVDYLDIQGGAEPSTAKSDLAAVLETACAEVSLAGRVWWGT